MTSIRGSSRACARQMSSVSSSERSIDTTIRKCAYVWLRAHRSVLSMNPADCQAGMQQVTTPSCGTPATSSGSWDTGCRLARQSAERTEQFVARGLVDLVVEGSRQPVGLL